jgi:hypothetical protein
MRAVLNTVKKMELGVKKVDTGDFRYRESRYATNKVIYHDS